MKTKKDSEKKIKVQTPENATDEHAEAGADEAREDAQGLEDALDAKTQEAREHYERSLRLAAELDNYKKRAARDRADTIKYGKEEIIRDILPFLDSLDRALEHKDSADAEAFKEGMALMQDQLLCCLKKHGVERIDSEGKDFDPNFHEALMQVESDRHDENQVVTEVEKGYLLNGRLIRPSRVCVCKKPDINNQKSNINEETGE